MTRVIEMEPLLTVGEAATLLHVHTNTVRRWANRGYIRAYRVNYRGDRRFRQEEITRVAAELKVHHGNEKKAILALK